MVWALVQKIVDTILQTASVMSLSRLVIVTKLRQTHSISFSFPKSNLNLFKQMNEFFFPVLMLKQHVTVAPMKRNNIKIEMPEPKRKLKKWGLVSFK